MSNAPGCRRLINKTVNYEVILRFNVFWEGVNESHQIFITFYCLIFYNASTLAFYLLQNTTAPDLLALSPKVRAPGGRQRHWPRDTRHKQWPQLSYPITPSLSALRPPSPAAFPNISLPLYRRSRLKYTSTTSWSYSTPWTQFLPDQICGAPSGDNI